MYKKGQQLFESDLYLFLILFILIIMCSCNRSNTETVSLDGIAGITPGVTTAKEARKILDTPSHTYETEDIFIDNTGLKLPCGKLTVFYKNDLVTTIQLFFDIDMGVPNLEEENLKQKFSTDNVQQLFGNPEIEKIQNGLQEIFWYKNEKRSLGVCRTFASYYYPSRHNARKLIY